jgi:ABC-type oligopeptide transport system substrate-binding subunit/class 3 adenylate cyclase
MQCPKCQTDNPERARFCLKCGASLVLVCPACAAELPPHAQFCISCGARLATAAEEAAELVPDTVSHRLRRLVPKEYAQRLLATRGQVQAERRLITILFSDVKGSTAMAENLDPEDVMEIMDGAFDVLIEPVYRYEGTLARLMGDAVLAFFGAPIAHEDDPERACRAALDILKGASQCAARLEHERGITGFNVRVGIHTGLVVVGEVGSDLRVEYTAMGDAINLAARMESAARPGTVLISEATRKLVAPLFETEALGPIEVKGKAQPVSVYRVLAAKEVPGKLRGIAGLESPFVGREAQLQALRETLQRLQAGTGGVVTLVGEAGIGKSRLVAESRALCEAEARKRYDVIASEAKQSPPAQVRDCFGKMTPRNDTLVRWIEGRCLSYGSSIAYQLWLDVLHSLLGVTLDDAPQAVLERLRERLQEACPDRFQGVYPYVGRVMSLPLEESLAGELNELEGQDLRSHTFHALQTLIVCAANQRPLVVVCEDLHWADPTSIELLEQLLPITERVPLLLLCVFRPVKDHACWRFRERVAQACPQCHTSLLLDPLSPTESQTLVANLLEIDDLPEALREHVLSRAEGNPFYVEEVIRSLIDRGAVVQDPTSGCWTATAVVAEIPIPDTLQGVLMARIDRLQEDTRRVLQMAAVIGRIFLHRVLAEIAKEERRLDNQLLTLQQEEMIRERARTPELEYMFKHDLTREAAYNGLLKKQRRVFHRQVGEALERLFPERIEEQLGLLAYHWEQAGDAAKATEYLLRAGDKARIAYAHQEAVDFYRRALPFLKGQGEHDRAARTLMKLGLTYHAAFHFEAARRAHEEGFALWRLAAEQQPIHRPPPAPHPLRMGLFEPFSALDPAIAADPATSALLAQFFSGLVDWGTGMEVMPDLAQSWEVSAGGRSYTFHLRADLRWGDGRPLTAADFQYAWQRVLDPATGSQNARLLYDIRGAAAFHQGRSRDRQQLGVHALDARTLRVDLEEPTGYFLYLLAHSAAYPVPRHVVQQFGEAWTTPEHMVSNGPFQLQAWRHGEFMDVVRNPRYHSQYSGNVEKVRLDFVTLDAENLQEAWGRFEAGELDVLDVSYVPPSESKRMRQRFPGQYLAVPQFFTSYVGFVNSRPPFDSELVRHALVLATDRETLADVQLQGQVSPALGGFIPPTMPGHSPGIALSYDPERARVLLTQAGFPGGAGFPLVELMAQTDPLSALAGEFLRAQWQENLGIETAPQALEFQPYLERIAKDPPHAFVWGWMADYPDPDNFLRVGDTRGYTRWQNERYDDLVQKARQVPDQEQRLRLYREADRLLIEGAAVMPLVYLRTHFLVKPWLVKYPVSALRSAFWKDVIIEPH